MRKSKDIVNGNRLNSEGSLMHYKGRLSNYLLQLFLTLLGRPEENSSYFSNVQPCTITCTRADLLNTRICRYTCIHKHLQYKHYSTALQVHDVEMMSY